MAESFAEALIRISPPWLRRVVGGPLMRGLGDTLDVIRDGSAESVDARFPRATRATALKPIGLDRRILRAPNETDAAYAVRLTQVFTFWDRAGRESSIEAAFAAAGLTAVVVEGFEAVSLGHWARFAVYVDGTGIFAAPPAWDAFNWEDGTRWDFTTSDGALVDYLVASIRVLKPAHTRCLGVVIARTGYASSWVPVDPIPPGYSLPLTADAAYTPEIYLDLYLDLYLG